LVEANPIDNKSLFFPFLDRPIVKETKNLRVSLADFEIKTMIGSGYFGDVHVSQSYYSISMDPVNFSSFFQLVSDKHSKDVYAMKKIKKSMVDSFQVKEERDIMVLGRKSEWITKLQYAFQVFL
jgi:citron Rho-interacting kinase